MDNPFPCTYIACLTEKGALVAIVIKYWAQVMMVPCEFTTGKGFYFLILCKLKMQWLLELSERPYQTQLLFGMLR